LNTGSRNTLLGVNADCGASSDENSTVIGANAVGQGSNSVVIGNPTQTNYYLGSLLPVYADNNAAILGGLSAGALYRLPALSPGDAAIITQVY
jgi:hypothetical protein